MGDEIVTDNVVSVTDGRMIVATVDSAFERTRRSADKMARAMPARWRSWARDLL